MKLTSCPSTVRPVRLVGFDGADRVLIPFGPSRLLVCRYGGLNSGRSQQLVVQRVVSGRAAVASFVAVVNESGRHRWAPGSYACPADFAATTDLFAEAGDSGRWFEIEFGRTGCPHARNGDIEDAQITPQLARLLQRTVGPPGM